MNAVDVTTEMFIRDGLAKWRNLCRSGHAPCWNVNIMPVVWITPPSLQIGLEIAFRAQVLGRQLSYIYKVVEWAAGVMLVMRNSDGPFPMETTYTWHAIDDNKTHMNLRNSGIPSGFSPKESLRTKLFAPFMSLMIRKANKKFVAIESNA